MSAHIALKIKTLLCGCTLLIPCSTHARELDPASRLREQEERDISALANLCESENQYRIEKRNEGRPPFYWNQGWDKWCENAANATLYTEAQREEILKRGGREGLLRDFPAGGCWVVLSDPVAAIECDGCGATDRAAMARQLAEAVYALDWLVMTNGVMCKSCQARGIVTESDAMVDELDALEGD